MYRQSAIMSPDISEIPKKLQSRRVRSHVESVLISIRQAPESRRDAQRALAIMAVNWETLDLYTLAFDLCEDEELRFLVGQARGTIALELIKRSNHPR